MGKLILVRHGESIANTKEIFYGWLDSSLTDKGRNQAFSAINTIKKINYDEIYTSDLSRAYETGKILNYLSLEINRKSELRELNFGIFEGLSYETILKKYPKEELQWRNDWKTYNYESGESVEELQDRVISFVKSLDKEKNDILLVAHWGVINCILSYYVSGGLDGYWKFSTKNCRVSIINFKDDFAVLEGLNIGG